MVDAERPAILHSAVSVLGNSDDVKYFAELVAGYLPSMPSVRANLSRRRTPKAQRNSLLRIAAALDNAANVWAQEREKASGITDAVSGLGIYAKREFGVDLIESIRSMACRAQAEAETIARRDGRNKKGEHVAVYIVATCWLQAFGKVPSDASNSNFSRVMKALFPFFLPGLEPGEWAYRSRIRDGLAYWSSMSSK